MSGSLPATDVPVPRRQHMVKQERAARTRRSLIHAAAEVFAEVGFVSASLGAISRRAGVSNGALHFHFANKSMLAEAVEAEAVDKVRLLTEAARARQDDSLQAVVDAMHALCAALTDDVVVRGGFELSSDITRRATSPLRREWQRWVEESLARAERRGALAEGVAQNAARMVVALTVGLQVLGGDGAHWLSRQNVTGFWDLLLPGVSERRDLAGVVASGSRAVPFLPQQGAPGQELPER